MVSLDSVPFRLVIKLCSSTITVYQTSVSSEIDDTPAGTARAEDPLWKALFAFQS